MSLCLKKRVPLQRKIENEMKYGVIGVGAIGGYYGCK